MPISQIIMARGSAGGGGSGGFNGSPGPGTGSYLNSWPGSEGWSVQGSPSDPGGGISSIPNRTWGWRRVTYPGIWSNTFSQGNDNPSLFSGSETDATYDAYGSFGTTGQSDNYAMEWKGYIKATTTSAYNFLIDSDDVAMFWIGSAALDPDSNFPLITSNNSNQLNSNSVLLTADTWYPIRMRFQEWSGAERCQVFFGPAGTSNPLFSVYYWHNNYDALGWNTGTNGY
jgi:hypothetical protein